MFQSTPACERATSLRLKLSAKKMFQSTPACERATSYLVQVKCSTWFQSTPACERATALIEAVCGFPHVSIHARV